MTSAHAQLFWLPKPPSNFNEGLISATKISEIRALSHFALDDIQLNKLAKAFIRIKREGESDIKLAPIKIGLVSNATTKLIVPSLIATAIRYGINLEVIEADFNQVGHEAFSNESLLSSHKLDSILLSIDHHGLPYEHSPGDKHQAVSSLNKCANYLTQIINSLKQRHNCSIIVQNFTKPSEAFFGSYETPLVGTLSWAIEHLNIKLTEQVSSEIHLLDISRIASNFGLLKWSNPTLWNLAKIPFSPEFNPIYAEYVCRILAAKIGKSRRCLILDLDNTLWGGVIGDDGLEGILLGNGDSTGEAHTNLQKIILELHSRGIALAVSSKNEEETARLPFQKHPEMLLKESHIASFQANWLDKAANIKAIASHLSLGLESMVFLDDNPAERMLVRNELPNVAVPELPNDPALYGQTLLAAGYFEAISFSEEDKKRTTFYQGNAQRAQILIQSSDINEYLLSLKMQISFKAFDEIGRDRIVQLINKSNQFNLTTKRYSNYEIKCIELDSTYHTLQVRVKDVFGDNGMIGVVICKQFNQSWIIDTWLMSCRVLERKVEIAILQEIIRQAKECGVIKLIGHYIPTSRNIIVKDHYKKLGFYHMNSQQGTDEWHLDTESYQPIALPFEAIHI